MSYEYESQLDPANEQTDASAATPQWMLIGYLLGLIGMSPAPLLYYWLFAPAGALVVAALCALAAGTRPRLRTMAFGALAASAFGIAAVLTFFVALANQ